MGHRQRQRKRVRPRPAPPLAVAQTSGALAAAALSPARPTAPPPSGSALEELAWLVAEQRRLSDRQRQVVAALVADGTAWPAIAATLDVSRQAARQRYLRTHEPHAKPS
ncbi:MAG: hypothetical protein Q8R60_18585 [Mycobacteriales bacterium]|nr:hypothetical protein [Mycobacteriales bacterium]